MPDGGIKDERVEPQPAAQWVAPGIPALVADNAPTRTVLCAGAGSFEVANITLIRGIHVAGKALPEDEPLARWAEVLDRREEMVPAYGFAQRELELKKAGFVPSPDKGCIA